VSSNETNAGELVT